MNPEEIEILVEEWTKAQKAFDVKIDTDELHWAIEKLIHLPNEDPDSTWKVILGVLKRDDYKEVLDILAASPLEDLMTIHGEQCIEYIEKEIGNNPRLKQCMKMVWIDSEDTSAWKRFYELAEIEPPFK